MTWISSKRTILLFGLLFLVSCSTLNNLDKHGSTTTNPSSSTVDGVTPVTGNPESTSTQASSESPTAPHQETALINMPSVAAQPFIPDADPVVTEAADPVSSGTSNPDIAPASDAPGPADTVPDTSQDTLDADTVDYGSVGGAGNEATNDSESDSEEEITYDVPIVLNESVEGYIEYFQTEIRDRFKMWLERSGRYIPVMREIFKKHGLPEDLVFVALIESGFNPYAYSRSRAVGHWQFIKGTGRLYGLRIDQWIDERRDPIKSTDAAARYLKDLYERFGSWPLAMAGYNAGEGRIQRALIKAKTDDFWDLRSTRLIRRETKGYVPKFMAATIIAKNPERYGFTLDYHVPLEYDVITLPGSADLRVVAKAAGITYKDIKTLNPELRTVLTPPNVKQYSLNLPLGTQQAFTDAYSQIPDERKIIGTRYKIRKNDTLARIAKRFGTSVSLLRDINHRTKGQLLKIGDVLFIPKLRSIPQEPGRRMVAAARPHRHKTKTRPKKAPVQMASFETQGKTDSGKEGSKILYLVKDGDTLWDISQSFNVSIHDLKRYNGMGKRSMIRSGDQLVLGFQSKDL